MCVVYVLRTLACFLVISVSARGQTTSPWGSPQVVTEQGVREHPGGTLTNGRVVFKKAESPYWLRDDYIIERNAELVIEPGVEVRFEPQVGITVRGVLTAVGTDNEKIKFVNAREVQVENPGFPEIRLVDGPTILDGRVQLFHKGSWRSVCTNSRNWTRADMETACRQMGFQGGSFSSWHNKQMPLKARLLYEEPKCTGTEQSLFQCQWTSRQLGSGVCDYHPDLGIQCLPRHDSPMPYWRGIRFESAKQEKKLILDNTFYVPTSYSRLQHVKIYHAGTGRNQNVTSAIHVEGVPPIMENIEILNSAYNGINITSPESPIKIHTCTIKNNRGYGIFINSTNGLVHIDGCQLIANGADGLRYVHQEVRPDERYDKSDISDFCTLASTRGATFPIEIFAEQSEFANSERACSKYFETRFGHVLTLNFDRMQTDRNNSARIQVYDGTSAQHQLLYAFDIRNNTRPQSITSTSRAMYIKFMAEPKTKMFLYMTLNSGLSKTYDLNVTSTTISDNNGRGIAFDNLRSQIHIHGSSISNNNHVAGVHVVSGAGDVNITESRISFNDGDGVNITYTGGNRNISRSSISSNKGYGVAVWLNDTKETEYIYSNQTTVIQYSEIVKNVESGILHGNFCSESYVNITGNNFQESLDSALEIMSCWFPTKVFTKLQIGHNIFKSNERLGIKIKPALNIDAKIEYNHFRNGSYGAIAIKNKMLEEFNMLPTKILIESNYFIENNGQFVVNLGLNPYAEKQSLLFTRNFLRDNVIKEPFLPEDGSVSRLTPRSRVSAPIVISSSNVRVYRNIIQNPKSRYEIGSHLEDQSKTINCTYNWLGFNDEGKIFNRIFHRYDRYNLAKIVFVPYLLHNSNPMTNKINTLQLYVPQFHTANTNTVGGEVEGEETLRAGEYVVEKDINIRPGGKLTLEPGVTLRFPPSIGIMVGGKLEAKGVAPDSILLSLKEEIKYPMDNETYESDTEQYESDTEMIEVEPKVPIRLLGGKTPNEGRLQVKIDGEWGTVCNYGWKMRNAALVCHQLGLTLNPDDWFMERRDIPEAGMNEKITLTNVRCDEFDLDITKCKADKPNNFENSCTHEHDVGVRCYETSWAGMRFGVLAERSDLQFLTIERSGLLDYATNAFKPALQVDFSRHNFESIRVVDNYQDGLCIMYSDIYPTDSVNVVRNSEFSNNKGSGISFKQLGLHVHNSYIINNAEAGIRHNPMLTGSQQREISGWFIAHEPDINYKPIQIPQNSEDIFVDEGETKYMVTSRVVGDSISRSYRIKCPSSFVIGIQLLNPIENRSTEEIWVHDSQVVNNLSSVWNVNRDLTIFPTTSSSYGIVISYTSGEYAIGGTVFVLSTVRAPVQDIRNRIVKGPIPTLTVTQSKIKGNKYGLHASYYNRYLDELGDHFLRNANETFKLISCEISHNIEEAVFVNSPHWDIHKSNISEITIMVNNSLITDNGKGFRQFSRDMRSANNLFHYVLRDNTIERNAADGFDISLPYVWQYNENFTHSVYMQNNTWRNNRAFGIVIDGHFASVNITKSVFADNHCKHGLISIRGMEKKMKIDYNKIENNIGRYMVDFSSDSQSEILGEIFAKFVYNELRYNKFVELTSRGFGVLQSDSENPTCVIGFKGIQKVRVNRNLLSNNRMDYQLIAGIKTAKINNYLNVKENWWGTKVPDEIENLIFDFDDWNNHAIAQYLPYLIEDSFEGSNSVSYQAEQEVDLDNLGGRLTQDLILYQRNAPYIIKSDITVMPKITLTIQPGVIMEFAPNVGILVLGTLSAKGLRGYEITMRPLSKSGNLETNKILRKRSVEQFHAQDSIRLCKGRNCLDGKKEITDEGFLEYFNKTTLQWIPMCDARFTERNAQVVCRELGYDSLNVFFDHDIRIEFHSNSLSRIWSWPEPLQCSGEEKHYEECPIRLNGQLFGHIHECKWDSRFVFVKCGKRNLRRGQKYWGGIRFAGSEFEQNLYEHRIHDVVTHDTVKREESVLEFVNIMGAGILHNEKSPAVQSIIKSPSISYINITRSASDGINLISPANTINLQSNYIENTLGVGINALSLTGEGRESEESSFVPLQALNIPYNLFSLVDICDTSKEITIEERVLLYYKYDNHPVNCVKIFRSAYSVKPFGFRLLQFNLFNSTNKPGIPDFISLYDGDIYNVTSTLIGRITVGSGDEKKLFRTKEASISVKLFSNGASAVHGFIAEIVTLPISAIGFNRDVQHNISNSIVKKNREGGLLYVSVGEVNPILTIDRNQFTHNCEKLYGNFSTCKSSVELDVQNTQTLYFRNNLVKSNQGGLSIKADSRGSATSLKGYIHNNLFLNNTNLPALYVEGRQSSPYQEVTIYRNYFTQNYAEYQNTIILKQVVSNFTYNYVKRNIGLHNLEVSGFDKVRLPIYQTTSHNGFYDNYAVHLDSRSTVVAGTAGQHYVDNIFENPANDYEMITVNRSLFNFSSTLELWKTRIDASYNYWGYNTTLAVSGRIKDQADDPLLLEVHYSPYYMNNKTILNGKCPPGWDLVGDTCYIYIGAPMTYYEAKEFCRSDNASMPYLIGNYFALNAFLRKQQEWFQYSERVWVQDIDRINQCTMFAYDTIDVENCYQLLPFVCEIDPKVLLDPLNWHGDVITVAVVGAIGVGILLIALVAGCWYTKSKYRHAQRLERRNSIRQSLHSVRSIGSVHGGFSELGYRRKGTQMSTRSTDTLTKNSDYKKMNSNGSIDSMEKSAYNSSVEDNQSYDIYEAHNPNPTGYNTYSTPVEYHNQTQTQPQPQPKPRYEPARNQYATPGSFDLAYKNEGYRDNSTFASRNNSTYQSRAASTVLDESDESPIIHSNHDARVESYPPSEYYNSDTLPLHSPMAKSDSTLDLKRGIDETNNLQYGVAYGGAEKPNMNFLQELKTRLPANEMDEGYQMKPTTFGMSESVGLPTPPDPPRLEHVNYSPDYNTVALEHPNPHQNGYNDHERPKSANLLETNFDESTPKRMPKAKSEALLETNFDTYDDDGGHHNVGAPINEASRSKSQPLETAM